MIGVLCRPHGFLSMMLSVVFDDSNIGRPSVVPDKDDLPLDVDANRMVATPISLQSLQPSARRYPQVLQLFGVIEVEEL